MSYQKYVWILFVSCLYSEFYKADAVCGKADDTKVLLVAKFKDVPTEVAPDGVNGELLAVKHNIQLMHLLALENNVLVLHLWESILWQDTRLQWSPKAYGFEEVSVPSQLLWQPDILLYNSAEEYKGFPPGDLNALVQYDGNVSLIIPKITKAYCHFYNNDVKAKAEIPCTLKYGSWTRSGHVMDLQRLYEPEIMNNDNPRWNITSFKSNRKAINYKCCPEVFLTMDYTLKILPL